MQLVALRVSNDMANRQFCLSWLKATYETQTDNFTLRIEQKLMYKQYLASLYKMGVKDVISAQQYAMCVRWEFIIFLHIYNSRNNNTENNFSENETSCTI